MKAGLIERLMARAVAGLVWLLTGATARWQGVAPDGRQRVYFANHASHLDFVVLWSALPPSVRAATRPVAGADYWNRDALRRFLAGRVFRAVLIERRSGGAPTRDEILASARAAVAATAAALDDGSSIILFPEGTRGPGGMPQPFKSGLFHLCCERSGLELVPVWLDNLNRVLPKGEFLPVPLSATATFGAPLRLEPGEERDAFLERMRAALVALWSDRPRSDSAETR
ncbi:1-acyl-sn-glycerol-3-phosphate acyltransferase [Amaricoccus sp.]|uniref:lysophospholipid acyltransferase family protein n=1 Tax=Amaricoccus sp. TaxID=1872485 RepID=UPI0025B9A302|nr:lysophospholipid acyltransferase family protein [Amaricoccus sp.]